MGDARRYANGFGTGLKYNKNFRMIFSYNRLVVHKNDCAPTLVIYNVISFTGKQLGISSFFKHIATDHPCIHFYTPIDRLRFHQFLYVLLFLY